MIRHFLNIWTVCGLLLAGPSLTHAGLFDEDPVMNVPSFGNVFGEDQPAATKGKAGATVTTYASKPFVVIADIELEPHWHVYFTNPGTVGLAMEASMPDVAGFDIEGPFFSVPQKFDGPLGVSYGYEKPRIAFRVTPKADAPASAEFTVKATLQMCRDGECRNPEDVAFSVKLEKGDGKPVDGASAMEAGFVGLDPVKEWNDKIDKLVPSVEGDTILLNIDLKPGATFKEGDLYFFSADGEVLPKSPQTLERKSDDKVVLKMKRNLGKEDMYPNQAYNGEGPLPEFKALKGVLVAEGKGMMVDEPVGVVEQSVALVELLAVMGGLFLGGLILNVMPCVFPVIGLKILSFVELGGGDRRKVLSHSLVFVLGVLVSFWVITGALALLKVSLVGSGQVINWAAWMEIPWVVFGLLLLLLVLGLSMYGVFEIGVRATGVGAELQHKKGWAGSFWSGVLATVIATPCSAPFLGSAMPTALALPTWGMFMAFTSMALGMSLPYILLSAFPSLVKYLPRPGAWMESFKQALSFLLFGTAAWLLWVYAASHDSIAVFLGIVIFAAGWWVYGRWCPLYRRKTVRIAGAVAALALWGSGIWMACPREKPALAVDWQPWSAQAEAAALEEGRPVYIDFTARWCNTCLVNKAVAYSDQVIKLANDHDVLFLKADKTSPNPAIDAKLRELGRSSVPVNVLFMPGDSTPYITSEILTPGYLENFLKEKLEKKDDAR